MRFIVLVLLFSSFVFAQDPAQIAVQQAQQAQQAAIQQTQQAQQSAIQASQQQNDAARSANQQTMDTALNTRRNWQAWNVTSAPKFWPKPGTFKDTTPNVTMTDATKDAVIYFTTDGATPTIKSQRYTGPIALAATTTVKAMAIAPSLAPSPTARGKYVVK